MATGRFRSPKTEKEEIALLSETVPKNTKYIYKMGGERFYCLADKNEQKTQLETGGGNGLESTDVADGPTVI